MSAYILSPNFEGSDLVVSKLSRVKRETEYNSTRSGEDLIRVASEVESTLSSTVETESLTTENINKLYSQKELYLSQRNGIINHILKRLFYRKELRHLERMLEDIDYKIYFIESDSTKKLIRLSEQKLLEDSVYLDEIKKKYDSQ